MSDDNTPLTQSEITRWERVIAGQVGSGDLTVDTLSRALRQIQRQHGWLESYRGQIKALEEQVKAQKEERKEQHNEKVALWESEERLEVEVERLKASLSRRDKEEEMHRVAQECAAARTEYGGKR